MTCLDKHKVEIPRGSLSMTIPSVHVSESSYRACNL